ncbi:MAG: ATP-binding protein [Candidatus Baltobacteraceae bacterium]
MNAATAAVGRIETVELRIPRKAEWVAVARLAVAAVANRLAFSVEDIEDLKLAIAEACTNCIRHTNGNASIDIVCEAEPDLLRLIVRDHCFDLPPQRPRAVGEPAGDAGGLGIFIIESLMDHVAFEPTANGPTELVMTKRVGA